MTSPSAAPHQPSHQPPARLTWAGAAAGVAALLVLNGLLSFGPLWPTPGVTLQARLAPEFVGVWLLLLGLAAWRPKPSRRTWRVLSASVLLLVIGRYAEVTAPSLFGRPVNLYWDLPQLPRFLWVSAMDHPAWLSAAVALAALAAGAALYAVIRLTLATLWRTLVPWTLVSFSAWVLSFAVTLLAASHLAGVAGTWRWVAHAALPHYAQQLRLLWDAHAPGQLAWALPAITPTEDTLAAHGPRVLDALKGRDLTIIFLESFGAVLYDQPEARAATDPSRQALQQALDASGRHVVSGFFRSPTIGGASDLAHLSLLSGIDLSDPRRHNLLLTTRRPTLLHLARQAGYETFGLYHAVSWPWPEHAYYGFDRYIDGPALGYEGPPITFWKIPDQVALARYEQLHPRHADSPPRLTFFPTISSHFPFSPVPPYQPDWQRVLTPMPFDAEDLATVAAQRVNWLDMRGNYLDSVRYVYQWLSGHFERPQARDTVYVLVGDHQPTANITGERPPWDVPVHIVSRDRHLLERFKAQGFSEGLWPDRAVLGGLHHLTSLLLGALGPEAEGAHDQRATGTPGPMPGGAPDPTAAGVHSFATGRAPNPESRP